ncbi:uncharacterized protein LOC120274521 [Dioscorea cayenensis subsp. rotundata]|uniref:Uncharacterized protein LOC120274521 n=1 Tax=Dioscorea cayennensis subsp. rotundata TaxID=55577 RepID=A0AB40CE15_DIOCR|nr:uncharacterized protein LOC120274521 [Dioscorea cayenensis subsp. rotundata]
MMQGDVHLCFLSDGLGFFAPVGILSSAHDEVRDFPWMFGDETEDEDGLLALLEQSPWDEEEMMYHQVAPGVDSELLLVVHFTLRGRAVKQKWAWSEAQWMSGSRDGTMEEQRFTHDIQPEEIGKQMKECVRPIVVLLDKKRMRKRVGNRVKNRLSLRRRLENEWVGSEIDLTLIVLCFFSSKKSVEVKRGALTGHWRRKRRTRCWIS